MRKPKKAKKTPRIVKKIRIHKIRLATDVVRVVASKKVAPVVVHREPNVIEIIPAPRKNEESWWKGWLK